MPEDGPQFLDACAACGAPLVTEEWHPVVTESVENETSLYSFCDKTCRETWADGRTG